MNILIILSIQFVSGNLIGRNQARNTVYKSRLNGIVNRKLDVNSLMNQYDTFRQFKNGADDIQVKVVKHIKKKQQQQPSRRNLEVLYFWIIHFDSPFQGLWPWIIHRWNIGLDGLRVGYIIKRYNVRFNLKSKQLKNLFVAQYLSEEFIVLFCWPDNQHYVPVGLQLLGSRQK